METLTNNPWLGLCGICCLWPGLLAAVGFYVGRYGLPFSVAWRGRRDDYSD